VAAALGVAVSPAAVVLRGTGVVVGWLVAVGWGVGEAMAVGGIGVDVAGRSVAMRAGEASPALVLAARDSAGGEVGTGS